MKRALSTSLACLVALAGAIVSASSSGAAPYPRLDEMAFAHWSFPTGEPGRTVEYGASIYRTEDLSTGDVNEYAGFYKARCKTEKIKNGSMTMCRGFAGERATDYYFDPMLQSAWVEGKKSRVEWATEATKGGTYFMEEGCYSQNAQGEEEEGSGSGAGRYSDAEGSGDIAGQDMSAAKRQYAALQIGAAITECSLLTDDQMERMIAGEPFRYSYTTRR